MSRNVEIKARIESIESILAKVVSLADSGPTTIHQDDTFFSCPNGRLKLRKRSDTDGELIFYQRADSVEPKESFYIIATTSRPDALHEVLSLAYGVSGRIRKARMLFMVGRTRIHLDRVEELGEFLELEVVLAEDEPVDVGQKTAEEIMQQLGLPVSQLIAGAYVDLIRKGLS